MSISAMKQAYVALGWYCRETHEAASKALRQAIAEAEKQEPVAWFIQYEYRHEFLWREPTLYERNSALEIKPLYTAPPKREWVGLTDEERGVVVNANFGIGVWEMAKAIEAKLKEKNG